MNLNQWVEVAVVVEGVVFCLFVGFLMYRRRNEPQSW